MIETLRIDHRLLHGQVVFTWVKFLDIDHIIVANDKVSNDDIKKMSLKLAKPTGVGLDILSIEDSIKRIKQVKEKRNLLILVENTKDALKLAKHIDDLEKINYGGIDKKDGSKQFSKAIFLDEEELTHSRKLKEMGIRMEIRQLPSDPIKVLNDMI
ncbi:PTS sugar transporter subunit IIB [Sporohalobacter salinus]|uniref:PTS sugar transporter subunit IIB n=1 Tax=Sporohalobacter salinus TaxID=1494606 RepID=UPI001960AE9E|nr:PTS sugar transporter subunit IIB [Sporohalobacter salinus]MBM7624938.1 PTS system mannose-specific IIB component [Sporohalobacter salinus]